MQKTGLRTKFVVWIGMACCWAVQGLAARYYFDADGIAYQNIVDACLAGHWHALVNGYWSPGYPSLLALWFKLFHPGAYYVPLTIRFFGILSLMVCLAAFEYFLIEFSSFRREVVQRDRENDTFVSDGLFQLIAYALFLWITVYLTPASMDHPDIWVFTLVLLASGLSMRLAGSQIPKILPSLLLGLVLGCAYLLKVVMFPLSFPFFVSLLFYKNIRKHFWKLALAVIVFAAVGSPLILELSKAKGRLTYGDAGTVNYQHVLGGDAEPPMPSGTRLAASPHISEYTSILSLGTYPPWADPSYGFAGRLHGFSLRKQISVTHIVLKFYFGLYVVRLGCLLAGWITLLLYSGNLARAGSLFSRETILWLPAISGFVLYALVRAEGRFMAGFTMTLFASGIAALAFDHPLELHKAARSLLSAVALILLTQAIVELGHEVSRFSAEGYPDWKVAWALAKMGVKPGDRSAYLGDTLSNHVWAYLAHVSVAAEIPQEDEKTFWAASEDEKVEVIRWLSKTGVKVLVTRGVADSALSEGWKKVESTDFFVLDILKNTEAKRLPSSSTSTDALQ
jgi:hypothetical protein